MQSGIDIVMRIYQMVHVPALMNALGGEYLWQHNWPRNSKQTEVCISIPTTDAYESKLRFVDIDVRTPNLGVKEGEPDYYPYIGQPQDNTFPDLAKLKEVVDILLPLIQSTGSMFVETVIPGVPRRDSDDNWIVNIRVEFTLLDDQDSLFADLIALQGLPDGWGGFVPTRTSVWSGQVQRVNIVENPQFDKTAGAYGLFMRCSWLIPREIIPEKDMQLVTPDGEYIITGIFPEGVFWRLTSTRKDTKFTT